MAAPVVTEDISMLAIRSRSSKADCPFAQLQASCSPAADHTFELSMGLVAHPLT
jgi:hypothetical protein